MFVKCLYVLVVICAMNNLTAMAHPGGHGPVDEQHAMTLARDVAGRLTEFDAGLGFGQLKESWKSLPENAAFIQTRGEGYFIIGVTNQKENRTLFLLISATGAIFDANFTGVFEGLQ